MRKIVILTILFMLVLVGSASARMATQFHLGTTAFQFVKLPVSARATALGNSYSALVEDSTALFWNPAGLAGLKGIDVQVMYSSYFIDTSYQFMSVGMPVKVVRGSDTINYGSFGIGLKYVDYGVFEYAYPTGYTTEPDESGDTFTAYDYVLTIGYGKQLTESFRFGVNFNYLYEKLEEWEADAYSFDLGFTYQNPDFMKDIRLAFSAGNMGSNVEFYHQRWEMPVIARYGIFWNFYKSPAHDFLTVIEFVQYNDAAIKSSIGFEYTLNGRFVLRSGYQAGYDAYDSFSAGVGMKVPFGTSKGMNIDLSFNPSTDLGGVFRAQIGIQF